MRVQVPPLAPIREKKMIQEKWFYTPIWFDRFQGDFSVAANKCLELRDSGFPNRRLSNVGGWQSDNIDLLQFPEFNSAYEIILSCMEEVRVSIHHKFKLMIDNIWLNINEKGHYNNSHVHPNSTLAGVLYLQCDEDSGRIGFMNDNSVKKHYPFNFYHETTIFSDYAYYTPETGMSIVFPSWTDHFVEQSLSDIPRISIAYNLKEVT